MNQQPDQIRLIGLAGEIVSAYVSNNRVQRSELSSLISDIYQALTTAKTMGSGEPTNPEQPRATAQEIKRSTRPDHLVSFEDGKPYKTLRRHLATRGLTPQAYREKWGLPADYPMVSANYSKSRSELARTLGLGQQRRQGLAEMSPQKALKVEAFEEAAESPAGEESDDGALAQVAAAPEPTSSQGKPKRGTAPRARKRKSEPATA